MLSKSNLELHIWNENVTLEVFQERGRLVILEANLHVILPQQILILLILVHIHLRFGILIHQTGLTTIHLSVILTRQVPGILIL